MCAAAVRESLWFSIQLTWIPMHPTTQQDPASHGLMPTLGPHFQHPFHIPGAISHDSFHTPNVVSQNWESFFQKVITSIYIFLNINICYVFLAVALCVSIYKVKDPMWILTAFLTCDLHRFVYIHLWISISAPTWQLYYLSYIFSTYPSFQHAAPHNSVRQI